METGPLFNPGFLGGNFLWWIGQIADDSTWRENLPSYKHSDPSINIGWGYRYKVRIIGLHDQGEEIISSEQLPWAQVMYPVTAGGGQASSAETPNLRQGNMVFGFFMDGIDQQIPVIMGVLGNNPQTKLNQNFDISKDEDANDRSIATTGYVNKNIPINSSARSIPPDKDKTINQDGNLQIESTGGHQTSGSDLKREWYWSQKFPLFKGDSDEQVASAFKSIQIVTNHMTEEMDLYLSAVSGNYTDTLISGISNGSQFLEKMKSLKSNTAPQLSKYTKVITDKVQEFALKKFNENLTSIVSKLPSTERWKFSDVKQQGTSLLIESFNDISDGLSNDITGVFDTMLGNDFLSKLLDEALKNKSNDTSRKIPKVPMCKAETIVAEVLVKNESKIGEVTSKIFDSIEGFLGDTNGLLASAGSLIDGDIEISPLKLDIASALKFDSIKGMTEKFEKPVNKAVSDFYQITQGSGGISSASPESLVPSMDTVKEKVDGVLGNFDVAPKVPFLQPGPDQNDVEYKIDDKSLEATLARENAALQKAIDKEESEKAKRLLNGETVDGVSFEF